MRATHDDYPMQPEIFNSFSHCGRKHCACPTHLNALVIPQPSLLTERGSASQPEKMFAAMVGHDRLPLH